MLLSEVSESYTNTDFLELDSPFVHGQYLQRKKGNEKMYYQRGRKAIKSFGTTSSK